MIELIVIDLDDTIYAERNYFAEVFSAFENQCSFEGGKLLSAYDKIDRCATDDILGTCLELSHGNTKQNNDLLFNLYCTHDCNLILPSASKTFLEEAKSYGFLLAILTNGVPAVQKNKMRLLGVSSLVDKCFCAREIGEGKEKPHPIVYGYVLNYFGISAQNAVMIGNDFEKDCIGAMAAGLSSIHVESRADNLALDLYFDKVIQIHEKN